MPDCELAWQGANRFGNLSLDVTRLRAEGVPVYPQFVVPLSLAFRAEMFASGRDRVRLWSVSCSLIHAGGVLSDHQGDVIDRECFANDSAWDVQLRFPLDLARVEFVERQRTEDAPFTLRGVLAFDAIREQEPAGQASPAPESAGRPSKAKALTRLGRGEALIVPFSVEFAVPRSQWVSALLPKLGWCAIRIFELPIPQSPAWSETFATAFAELDAAQRLFREGSFDQTVAHCRSALEPFRKKVQDLKPILKDARSSPEVAAKEFALLHAMASDTAEWLSGQLERHHTLSSVAHHVPAVGHFSRDQAHALLLHTSSLVLYAGNAISTPQATRGS
jgi:hypothetical protein